MNLMNHWMLGLPHQHGPNLNPKKKTKLLQKDWQRGPLCFQEAPVPRAQRKDDEVMPQSFDALFRASAADHAQGGQQTAGHLKNRPDKLTYGKPVGK